MPTSRHAPSSHHSEFTTFAGGNYRGAPNDYPQEQYVRQDPYTGQGVRDDLQRDCGTQPVRGLVRGDAWQPSPLTYRGRIQEVPRTRSVGQGIMRSQIKSQQELGMFAFVCFQTSVKTLACLFLLKGLFSLRCY